VGVAVALFSVEAFVLDAGVGVALRRAAAVVVGRSDGAPCNGWRL
jgi:hypothetical protein